MDLEKLRRKFPANFPIDKLPAGAKEEAIPVFRICLNGKVEAASFLPTYQDELALTKENYEGPHDIGWYSLSTFEDIKEVKKLFKWFRRKYCPEAVLAKGVTCPACGPCQRTQERDETKKSHVDWWLYEQAKPYLLFNPVNLEGGSPHENT